jgi:Domain of unknown function (DUF1996)
MAMARRVVQLAVLAALVMVMAATSPSRTAGALSTTTTSTKLSFVIKCKYVLSASVDPIAAPGQRPSAHRHDFFGNTTINEFSTVTSMRAAYPDNSRCGDPKDTAGYWIPSLYVDGRHLLPVSDTSPFTIYYTRVHLRNTPPGDIHVPPANLRLVVGKPEATSGPFWHTRLYWGCGGGRRFDGTTDHIPNCASLPKPHHLELHIQFPECLAVHANGTPITDSPDHKQHAAYAFDGVCPAHHPYAIAQVIERVRWDSPPDPTRQQVTLSSGGWWTMHGDFWQTWHQAELAARVKACFVHQVHCGTQYGTLT